MYAMSCDRVSDCASEPTAALWDLAVPATQSINPTRTIPRKDVQARSFRRIHTCGSFSSEAIMLVMVSPLVKVDETAPAGAPIISSRVVLQVVVQRPSPFPRSSLPTVCRLAPAPCVVPAGPAQHSDARGFRADADHGVAVHHDLERSL